MNTLQNKYERFLYREFGLEAPYGNVVNFVDTSHGLMKRVDLLVGKAPRLIDSYTSKDVKALQFNADVRNRLIKIIIMDHISHRKEAFWLHLL